jgi:hypothetical protein
MSLYKGLHPAARRRAVVAPAVAAVVLLTGAVSGCQQSTADQGDGSTLAAAEGPRVTYAVTSDGPIASVSYTDSEGEISTDLDVGDGWTGAARMPTESAEPTLSAIAGAGSTTIGCSISVGGSVVEAHTSVGHPPAKVVCGASVTAGTTPGQTSTGPVVETDIVDGQDHAGGR